MELLYFVLSRDLFDLQFVENLYYNTDIDVNTKTFISQG